MRIYIQSDKRCVSIPIPLSIARTTVKIAITRSAKRKQTENTAQSKAKHSSRKDNHPSKREIRVFLSAAVKILKDYRRENGEFVLVEVNSEDGENITITV